MNEDENMDMINKGNHKFVNSITISFCQIWILYNFFDFVYNIHTHTKKTTIAWIWVSWTWIFMLLKEVALESPWVGTTLYSLYTHTYIYIGLTKDIDMLG